MVCIPSFISAAVGAFSMIFFIGWVEGSCVNCDNDIEYDYIVVGSGPGGAPVASRLALAGYRTLLIEAGPDFSEDPLASVPGLHPRAVSDESIRWDFRVTTSDTANGPRDDVLYPRSANLGGCAIHNAMITHYPHSQDWEDLANLTGDESFRNSNMRNYFKKIEANQYIVEDPNNSISQQHGYNGYFKTSLPDANLPLLVPDDKITAILTALPNIPALPSGDLNSIEAENEEGHHFIPGAVDTENNKFERSSPVNLIRETQLQTDNLTVWTETFVLKILLRLEEDDSDDNEEDELPRAIGVRVQEGSNLYGASPINRTGDEDAIFDVFAKKEVIISAGTFNTPQILMLSGVGDKDELEALDIEPKVHLPGVGKNLQDRLEISVNWKVDSPWELIKDCKFLPDAEQDPCFAHWLENSQANSTVSRVYGSNGGLLGIQAKSDPDLPFPDIHQIVSLLSFRGYFDNWDQTLADVKDELSLVILKGHTKNRNGTIRLSSGNEFDPPVIDFAGFDEDDISVVSERIQIARQQLQPLLNFFQLNLTEVVPGPNVQTVGELREFIRANAWGHHACGTAKMSSADDVMGVVDSKFRVRGVQNLRVVDASVINKIPGFYIATTILLLSEKAADDILADASLITGQPSPDDNENDLSVSPEDLTLQLIVYSSLGGFILIVFGTIFVLVTKQRKLEKVDRNTVEIESKLNNDDASL